MCINQNWVVSVIIVLLCLMAGAGVMYHLWSMAGKRTRLGQWAVGFAVLAFFILLTQVHCIKAGG